MRSLPFDPVGVRTTHDDVLRIVMGTDWPSLDLRAMGSYPRGWCSAMSYSIGRLLLHRGMGRWRIAANGSHDWLEYVKAGDVIYSVDATQHQFPEHPAAWFGYGLPPRGLSHPASEYAICGEEPTSWAKWPEQVVSAEVMRRLG